MNGLGNNVNLQGEVTFEKSLRKEARPGHMDEQIDGSPKDHNLG